MFASEHSNSWIEIEIDHACEKKGIGHTTRLFEVVCEHIISGGREFARLDCLATVLNQALMSSNNVQK